MKGISIFANDKTGKSDNYPDYRIVASYKDGDKWVNVTVGQLWADRNAPEGHPKLKGELSKSFVKDGKTFDGYSLVKDGNMEQVSPKAPAPVPKDEDYTVNQVDDFQF